MDVITLWVAASLVLGQGQAAVFPTKADCMSTVARVEALMVEDGNDDEDMVSGCQEIVLKQPALSL